MAEPPRPVGRPAALSCEVLQQQEWWVQLLDAVRDAPEILAASYQFDNPALSSLLDRRLRDRSMLDVTILVDKEQVLGRTIHYQRSRLMSLKRSGASIILCSGDPPHGSFHVKAVIINRRICFCGSANLTYAAATNAELCLRLTGPPVAAILFQLMASKARGKEWDGV